VAVALKELNNENWPIERNDFRSRLEVVSHLLCFEPAAEVWTR